MERGPPECPSVISRRRVPYWIGVRFSSPEICEGSTETLVSDDLRRQSLDHQPLQRVVTERGGRVEVTGVVSRVPGRGFPGQGGKVESE